MYCKNLLKRSRNLKTVFYCKEYKRYIDYRTDCKNCSKWNMKTNKPIKKRTAKQNKLEKERFSILTTDFTKCYICGKPKKEIHELYGGCNRQTSMKLGLCIPICRMCHNKWEIDKEFRKKYQAIGRNKFIELYGYDKFMQEFKKSYL